MKNKKFSKCVPFIFLVLGLISNFYYVALNVFSKPHPFHLMDEIKSVNNIWILFAAFMFVMFFFNIRGISIKLGKKVKISLFSFISLGIVIAFINLLFICNPKIDETKSAEYIFLLGGGVYETGELGEIPEQRLLKCVDYMEKNPESICIPSGWSGKKEYPFSEADIMARDLIELGISEDRILIEPEAKDTIQNLQYSMKVIAKREGVSDVTVLDYPIVIITSDSHLRRALRLANRIGFTNISGIAADTPLLFIPNAYLREILAYVKLNLRIFLTGEPKEITK